MRMRKLPWAAEYLEHSPFVVKDPSVYQGKWKEVLHCEQLHVEIGCGKGDYLVSMSKMNPQAGWVGVEKDTNVAAIAARKWDRDEATPNNGLLIVSDAQNIENWFKAGEIDVLHLNFSDPWPKKRAHKKRLSHASFIARYQRLIQEQGEIQMKTDNASLFEFSLLQFQEGGWFLHAVDVDYRRNTHEEDAVTEYEQRFLNADQPIYRAVWKKFPYVNRDKKKR